MSAAVHMAPASNRFMDFGRSEARDRVNTLG
jgi:hypothetical protein